MTMFKRGSELQVGDVLEGGDGGRSITRFEAWTAPTERMARLGTARIAYSGTYGRTIFDDAVFRLCDEHGTYSTNGCLNCWSERERQWRASR